MVQFVMSGWIYVEFAAYTWSLGLQFWSYDELFELDKTTYNQLCQLRSHHLNCRHEAVIHSHILCVACLLLCPFNVGQVPSVGVVQKHFGKC